MNSLRQTIELEFLTLSEVALSSGESNHVHLASTASYKSEHTALIRDHFDAGTLRYVANFYSLEQKEAQIWNQHPKIPGVDQV